MQHDATLIGTVQDVNGATITVELANEIVVGEAVSLPVRTLVDPPTKDRRPDSEDPRVVVRGGADGFKGPAGWNQPREVPKYAAVVRQWRKQNPEYEHRPTPAGDGGDAAERGSNNGLG